MLEAVRPQGQAPERTTLFSAAAAERVRIAALGVAIAVQVLAAPLGQRKQGSVGVVEQGFLRTPTRIQITSAVVAVVVPTAIATPSRPRQVAGGAEGGPEVLQGTACRAGLAGMPEKGETRATGQLGTQSEPATPAVPLAEVGL